MHRCEYFCFATGVTTQPGTREGAGKKRRREGG
jgi:hypothetical protein